MAPSTEDSTVPKRKIKETVTVTINGKQKTLKAGETYNLPKDVLDQIPASAKPRKRKPKE